MKLFNNVIIRNLLGLLALVALHFAVDFDNLSERTGFSKVTPYIFLFMMYGWIVFHNRVLFDNLFMRNRRKHYFLWTGLAMLLFSLNMHYIISTSFHAGSSLPHIISFWVYTVAGLGIFVMWKHLGSPSYPVELVRTDQNNTDAFKCPVDGVEKTIPLETIYYIESLENYIRIITIDKPLVVRMPLKEAEERLPRPQFIRISKSCIVNTPYIQANDGNSITVNGEVLKVGKVFKKYVEAHLH
jgi:hypothetical protein